MTDMPAHTTDRLRHDIDRGVGRDKVVVSDPAAAPLGTDDEAAGTPPSRRRVAQARAHEAASPPAEGGEDHAVSLYVSVATAIVLSIVAAIYLIPLG